MCVSVCVSSFWEAGELGGGVGVGSLPVRKRYEELLSLQNVHLVSEPSQRPASQSVQTKGQQKTDPTSTDSTIGHFHVLPTPGFCLLNSQWHFYLRNAAELHLGSIAVVQANWQADNKYFFPLSFIFFECRNGCYPKKVVSGSIDLCARCESDPLLQGLPYMPVL